MVKISRKTIFMIILLTAGAIMLPVLPYVQAATDLSNSTIVPTPSTVYSLTNSTITVTVFNGTSLLEGASVGIQVEGGEFHDGTTIHNATSDALGLVMAQWRAPLVDADTNYNFTAFIKYASSINATKTTQVLVKPLDFSTSTFTAVPDEMNENEASLVTVVAQGLGGTIEGADVQIIGVGGNFTSSGTDTSTGQTDENGIFTDYWNAPLLDDPTDYTLDLSITYSGTISSHADELNITVNPVEGQLYYVADITPGLTVSVGQVVVIDLTVYDSSTGSPVEDVLVTFDAVDGNFTENGLDLFSDYTDALGKITVHWETTSLTPAITGTYYDIDIKLAKIGVVTNDSTLTFFVQEPTGILGITTEASETTIDIGDTVTITVTVTIDSVAYESAFVTIETFSGKFTESNDTEATGYTDSNGEFIVTWDTTDMIMSGGDPVNYTITITVDVFPNFLGEERELIITVQPEGYTPPGGGPDEGPFYTQWWFILAVGGGIVVIGMIVIFGRKK